MLNVVVNDDGTVTIHADARTVARLAGRKIFGRIKQTQRELQNKVRDAWYAADCPDIPKDEEDAA